MILSILKYHGERATRCFTRLYVRVQMDVSEEWSDGSFFFARKDVELLFFKTQDILRRYRNSSS